MEIASAFSNLITNAIKYTPKAELLPLAGMMMVNMLTLPCKTLVSGLTLNIYHV
jgi:signal transduction histidine kinase